MTKKGARYYNLNVLVLFGVSHLWALNLQTFFFSLLSFLFIPKQSTTFKATQTHPRQHRQHHHRRRRLPNLPPPNVRPAKKAANVLLKPHLIKTTSPNDRQTRQAQPRKDKHRTLRQSSRMPNSLISVPRIRMWRCLLLKGKSVSC